MKDATQKNKTDLLVVGVPEDMETKLGSSLNELNIAPIVKSSVAEAVKAIDIDDNKEINGLLLNFKNFPAAEKRAKQKGSDVFGFISAAIGLIEDALNKEVPIIITSAPDNCIADMVTGVMSKYHDVDKNVTIAKLSDADTADGLKTLLTKSAEATSFDDKSWNYETVEAEDTSAAVV
jgi:hypothetical protein